MTQQLLEQKSLGPGQSVLKAHGDAPPVQAVPVVPVEPVLLVLEVEVEVVEQLPALSTMPVQQ